MRRLFLLTLFCSTCAAAEIVGIIDGDTLYAVIDGQQQRIRLAQIDAPERNQAFGTAAKQALSELAFRKDCKINEVDRDRYGRIVGQMLCEGIDVNREMVASGHAWAYRRYVTDPSLLGVEDEARRAGKGLWRDPAPVAPWEFRKNRNSVRR